MKSLLSEQYAHWQEWARNADNSFAGWESVYPKWDLLMELAISSMTNPHITDEELKLLEFCWSISEETEDLSDYAKDNIEKCWVILSKLVLSEDRDVRWQVYSTLGDAGQKAEILLRKGLDDKLFSAVKIWLSEEWWFTTVAFPGRQLSWQEWEALPDK